MSDVAIKVIHAIPGRLRLEIPMLRDGIYAQTLELLVESLEAVTAARINPLARSIAVEYDRRAISEAHLKTELQSAIEAASHPDVNAVGLKPLSDYQAIQLTEYEARQFADIQAWVDEKPFWPTELLGYIFGFSKGLLNWLIPDAVFAEIGAACDGATANWEADWQQLKGHAEGEDYRLLRRGSLETCDRLAAEVMRASLERATAEGGLSSFTDSFGEVVNDSLTIVLALQTVHRTGLCYGYAPENEQEKAFAWGVFNLAIAATHRERERARKKIQNLRRALDGRKLEKEVLEESIEEDADDRLVDAAIEQALTQLAEETAGDFVPVLSLFLSFWADDSLISEVGACARRQFQLRWLLDNQKIRLVNAEALLR